MSLAELVTAGLVQPGTRFTSTNLTWPAEAHAQADGTVRFDGRDYPTLSSAASAALQGRSVNGWDFWAVEGPDGRTSLAALRARYQDTRPPE